MNEITEVFILGNHIQALGLSRLAAKIGLEVTVFNGYSASVARFSNSCRNFIRFSSQDHLLEMLLRTEGPKKALLVATNDSLIGFMAKHYDQLRQRYYLSIPRPEVVKICFNKRETYRKAMELGIPIPETYFPDSLAEVRELAEKATFPLIIKPAVMYKFHQVTGKKVFFCRQESDLIDHYKQILNIIPPEEVIVQQFLKGGAKSLYSFGSFFASGEVYGSLIANRVRQKPMDFGVSTCFAYSVLNQEIERLATDFLRAIDYFGLSEVEFMYDPESGTYRLIEINPRAWKWHSIANKLDINLMEMMVHFLQEQPIIKMVNDKEGIGWIERLTDTYVVLGEILKGRMSVGEYLQTLRMPKESATWSLRDPLPAIMYILMAPYLLFKRN